MVFKTAKSLLEEIKSFDLYSPMAEVYVFVYNDAGSIASYHISNDKAAKLSMQATELGGENWSALLGPGGTIYDDESDECYEKGCISNLKYCEELIQYDDWMYTEDFQIT